MVKDFVASGLLILAIAFGLIVLTLSEKATQAEASADTTAPATTEVVKAEQSETPATSPYPMAPPKVVALSEWTEYDHGDGQYRYVSVDGKTAVQFVTAGGQWRGISFVPRDATVTEAEDNSIPSPAPTPK